MVYYIIQHLLSLAEPINEVEKQVWFDVIGYVSVRCAGAALTAFILSVVLGSPVIKYLKRIVAEDYISEGLKNADGSITTDSKKGTPTMGGILIVFSVDIAALVWGDLTNELLLMSILSMILFFGLGFFDDYRKLIPAKAKEKGAGISEICKLVIQFLIAISFVVYIFNHPKLSSLPVDIALLFVKTSIFTNSVVTTCLGLAVVFFVIVLMSNAVNLTDGMDGLAIGCTAIVSLVFIVTTYAAGRPDFSDYLQINFVPGACELTVFCSALFGASIGFLWFNTHPAKVFMGDTGSLSIGGTLGLIAVLVHQPIILLIASGIFVIELGSSFAQRYCCKFSRIFPKYRKNVNARGFRLFLMAPLHHHFQKLGWKEPTIVVRFYIIAVLFAILALVFLKVC